MANLARLLIAGFIAGALTSTSGAPATASGPLTARAADAPSISYKNVDRECTTYTMDGQEQQQCRADFTLAVTNIKKGYKVVLTSRDPQYDMTTTVGTFTSEGISARKRFREVVISYGVPDDQIKMRFRVIVKNAAGRKVFASVPRTL